LVWSPSRRGAALCLWGTDTVTLFFALFSRPFLAGNPQEGRGSGWAMLVTQACRTAICSSNTLDTSLGEPREGSDLKRSSALGLVSSATLYLSLSATDAETDLLQRPGRSDSGRRRTIHYGRDGLSIVREHIERRGREREGKRERERESEEKRWLPIDKIDHRPQLTFFPPPPSSPLPLCDIL
jgi:hypothetical protein